MFRKSGVQKLELLDTATFALIRIPEMAAGIIFVPAGFTGAGAATLAAGIDDSTFLDLVDSDGSSAIELSLTAGKAVVLPPEAMIPGWLKITFAGALTQDETLYVLHKS